MDYRSHKLSAILLKATKNNVITWRKTEAPRTVKCSFIGQYFITTFKDKKLCIFQTNTYKIIIGILDDEEKLIIWNTTGQPTVMDDLYRLVRDIHYGIDSEKMLDELIASFKGS